ncbi:MAG: hypothetical protein ACI920_001147, partial [Saprospiraceae bacterium]
CPIVKKRKNRSIFCFSKNDSITWAIMLVLFPSKKHKK